MRTALEAVIADDVNIGGCVVFCSSMDVAAAVLADSDIQAAMQDRQLVALITSRGIGEGVTDGPRRMAGRADLRMAGLQLAARAAEQVRGRIPSRRFVHRPQHAPVRADRGSRPQGVRAVSPGPWPRVCSAGIWPDSALPRSAPR